MCIHTQISLHLAHTTVMKDFIQTVRQIDVSNMKKNQKKKKKKKKEEKKKKKQMMMMVKKKMKEKKKKRKKRHWNRDRKSTQSNGVIVIKRTGGKCLQMSTCQNI